MDLTEEMIIEAMAKADKRVCAGSNRCYVLPHRLEDARASCTTEGTLQGRGHPKGHRQSGWP